MEGNSTAAEPLLGENKREHGQARRRRTNPLAEEKRWYAKVENVPRRFTRRSISGHLVGYKNDAQSVDGTAWVPDTKALSASRTNHQRVEQSRRCGARSVLRMWHNHSCGAKTRAAMDRDRHHLSRDQSDQAQAERCVRRRDRVRRERSANRFRWRETT